MPHMGTENRRLEDTKNDLPREDEGTHEGSSATGWSLDITNKSELNIILTRGMESVARLK